MANASSAHASVTPSVRVASTQVSDVINAAAQIHLLGFDPDDTPYTMIEWMDEVTRIQLELNIFDMLIVLKAGNAVRGRATQFYEYWKPIKRDWASFRRDIEVAFPKQGTPATRVRACLRIVSYNFDYLVEYGNSKLASIKQFYHDFPWNIILSLVENDILDVKVKNRIRLQAPACEAELLKLLAVCDARKNSEGVRGRELCRKRCHKFRDDLPVFQGKCRNSHRYGNKQSDCKQETKSASFISDKAVPGPSGVKLPTPTNIQRNLINCTHCQKFYTEEWRQPNIQFLAGVGNYTTEPIECCTALMFTPAMILETDFSIFPDGFIPGGDIDALIGLDVLR
ncbi:hypothetical protein JTB14_031897 [Gonioctena quinquepunctata]|nr:hypothetical protein JTB14_031897 [Gonioctena quinquepunctata]